MKKIINVGILFLFLLLIIQPVSAKDYIEYKTESIVQSDGYYNIVMSVNGIDSESIDLFISKYPSDVVFVIDVSSSMDTEYNGKTRVDWAVEMSNDILSDFQSDSNVGLVVFSDGVDVVQELTPIIDWPDSSSISNNVKSSVYYLEGETHVYSGIEKGVELLNTGADDHSKYIIIFTDGKNSEDKDPIDIAKNANVPIYVVSIGEQNEIDSQLMSEIATVSGGVYIHVNEISRLSEKIRELIFKKEEISCQNFQFDFLPKTTDFTVDVTSISVTSGNAETKVAPQFTYEVTPTKSELITVTAPQLGMNDEILIRFSATPKRDAVNNFGTIQVTAQDPAKDVIIEKDITILSRVELDVNIDYPEMIYFEEDRVLEVTLTNPSSKEVSATVELQILGEAATTEDPLIQKVGLEEDSTKTVTWALKSTEPEKGEAILLIDIIGNDIIETSTSQKKIPIDNVYYDAKWYKYGKVLFIMGILLTLVGAVSYTYVKKLEKSKESKITSRYNEQFKAQSIQILTQLGDIKKLADDFYDQRSKHKYENAKLTFDSKIDELIQTYTMKSEELDISKKRNEEQGFENDLNFDDI